MIFVSKNNVYDIVECFFQVETVKIGQVSTAHVGTVHQIVHCTPNIFVAVELGCYYIHE